jgi:hypothetical protein
MLTPDDRRRDGQKTTYLEKPAHWRPYDPPLFDALTSMGARGPGRSVEAIEGSGILPGAHFFSQVLVDSAPHRSDYFGMAGNELVAADLWFFDPDNGLETRSVAYGAKGSAKYLYWHEVERVWSHGASLLIYQHFPRESREPYVRRRATELASHAPGAIVVATITAHVAFLVAAQPRHRARLDAAAELVHQRWTGQLSLLRDLVAA